LTSRLKNLIDQRAQRRGRSLTMRELVGLCEDANVTAITWNVRTRVWLVTRRDVTTPSGLRSCDCLADNLGSYLRGLIVSQKKVKR
jgi:hypothetical protein